MRIGLDFDNTLVAYDSLFHKVACERGIIPAETPATKLAVRDSLRRAGLEEVWTELQGTVYGARLDEAVTYPGVMAFLAWAAQAGHELAIVSHKTRHPFRGPQYDLHAAARAWVEKHLGGFFADRVFFELTKEAKLERIAHFGCTIFLDDLPEILLAEDFPAATERVLFDPDGGHAGATLVGVTTVRSWDDFRRHLEQ